MERGHHTGECVAAFPSVTPVCSASIATGTGPDRHQIPSMNWYHRGEERYVEYGTSFKASQAFGFKRSLTDTIYNMNAEHLSADTPTVFESLDDAGVRTAGTTYLMYRGRHRHAVTNETALTRIASAVFKQPVLGPARVLLRGHVRLAPHRLPLAARAPRRPRPARRVRRRAPRRARPVRLPAAVAAGQRHALAQARTGRPGHVARRRRQADRADDGRRRRRRCVPRGPRRDRVLGPLAVARRGRGRPLPCVRRTSPCSPRAACASARTASAPRSPSARARARHSSTSSTATPGPSSSSAPCGRCSTLDGVDLVMHLTDHPDGEAAVRSPAR